VIVPQEVQQAMQSQHTQFRREIVPLRTRLTACDAEGDRDVADRWWLLGSCPARGSPLCGPQG